MQADGAGSDREDFLHLRARDCSVVLDVRGPSLPAVLHWGADLGDLCAADLADLAQATTPAVAWSTLDRPPSRSLIRQQSEGYFGRPGLSGHRDGTDWSPLFVLTEVKHAGAGRVIIEAADPAAGLGMRSELELHESGMLRVRHAVQNQGAGPYLVEALLAALPIPAQASELLDFTGHWSRERHPQRHPLPLGAWVRENRRGRTGHDATTGLFAGGPGFGFRHGEVWAIHVGWSGNHVTYAERWPSADGMLGGGELLLPGEVRLEPGEEYATPWMYFAYSSCGLDGIGSAFHRYLRSRSSHPGPDRPRPVVLNTWEAVYFDLDRQRLLELADTAASLGVERFVLDDGWFRHRRDDSAGLGDWYPDETLWPDGLAKLIDHAHSLGMQFGLWVEPEMVSHDSDLYRAHPDWILAAGGRLPLGRRNQQVLDLANPAAYEYVRSRLDSLLSAHRIDVLKWDHNRDLIDAGHEGRPGVRLQTQAAYRLIDHLLHTHPGLEIESSSSGGARVDLGMVERTDRVWPSDSNDALERQTIQLWTGLFLPPELVGTHVGPPRAHTSGRVQDLSFRTSTALFGHAGIEWDITEASDDEKAGLAAWIRFYQEHRRLMHSGEVVHADHPDPAATVHGVVSPDRREALYAYVQLETSRYAVPVSASLPGLDPAQRYRVEPVHPVNPPMVIQLRPPPWYEAGAITLSGRSLEVVGITVPVLAPEQALLLRVKATPR